MKNFTMKMNKVGDVAPGGEPPASPPKPPAEQPPAAPNPPAKAEGDIEIDDFGYAKVPAADPSKKEGAATKAGDPPPETPVTKISEVKEPGTGYGEEPPKVDEVVAPPAPPVVPPAELDDFDKVLADIPKEDAKTIKDFATENKLTPEVAKKWADKVKANIEIAKTERANMERQADQQKKIQRKQWHDELKADATFGGEKFQLNVVRAERVLVDFGPDLKKQLTEGKGMLPPNVMRMLAAVANKLYATDTLPQGDPPPKAESTEEVDPVKDFYK